MKTTRKLLLSLSAAACLCIASVFADAPQTFEQAKAPRIAIVNFKTCVEKSKMGQKEQAAFEAMKAQMETVLGEKEKALTEVANKFNDIDYLDSLSPDAEAELKRQFRTLNQEFNQQQNQFYQTLSQTNMLVIQKITETVTKASAEVAQSNKIDLILNEDGCFFVTPALDISSLVVQVMDEAFEKDGKDAKPSAAPLDLRK